MPGVDRAARRVGGYRCKQCRRADAQTALFAFHIRSADAELVDEWIPGTFKRICNAEPRNENNRHCSKDGPALPRVFDHFPIHVRQRRADQKDQRHFKEIGKRRRVFVGCGRVRIDEAAAIGAQLFDDFLRGHGTAGDRLCDAFHRFHGVICVEVLRDALHHEDERSNHADWQQEIEAAARQVNPKISNHFRGRARDATNHRHRDRDADTGGNEVVPSQCRHLREVAHRALAGIELPVRVRGKTDGRVPSEVGR